MQTRDRRGLQPGVMQHHVRGVGRRILVLDHRGHDDAVRQAGFTQKLGATRRSGSEDERKRGRHPSKLTDPPAEDNRNSPSPLSFIYSFPPLVTYIPITTPSIPDGRWQPQVAGVFDSFL